MSSALPDGWEVSCLEEIATAVGGGTPPKSEPKYWFGGTIPWVSPKDMKATLVTDSEDHVTEASLDRLSVVPANSVLVVVRSGILSRTLPVARTMVPVTVNQDMRAFVPLSEVSPSYLAWQLMAMEREVLDKCSKDGTTVASIEGPALARFPLAIAPAAEQTRITAKLEELLSDLDAGVAELKAAQKKLQQYRQSLLKAAVEGALTAPWRETQRKLGTPTETGVQLLQRILTERRARWEAKQLAKFKEQGKAPPKDWQKKYPEPVQPDTTDLPELPEGWVWASLGQLLSELTSGSRDWAPFYDRGTSVFVMAQNVRPWRPDFSFKQFVDPPLDHRDRTRSEIHVDDLLVTIVGANTGQVCRVDQPIQSHFVCQSVALLRLVMPDMAEFVNAVLNSDGHGQRQFREMNYGAGRPHLSFDQLESVLVPLPPMIEQTQIITALTEAIMSCEQVELDLSQLGRQSTAQRQNILRAAFAGQLVPQDPNDEPASVLLERIRAERDARATQKKPRASKAREAA